MHPVFIYATYPVFGEAANLLIFAAPVAATLLFRLWVGILFIFINSGVSAFVFYHLTGMTKEEGLPQSLVAVVITMALCIGADRIKFYFGHRKPMSFDSPSREAIRGITRIKWMVLITITILHPVLLYLLYPVYGEAINLIVLIAPITASMMFGWRVGVVFTVINVFATGFVFAHTAGMGASEGRPKAVLSAFVILMLCVGADRLRLFIAQRKEMEQELNQAKKMEAIGRLAGGVAHDINNTLNAIMASVFAHQKELEKYHRPFTDIDNIVAACDRGAQLTRNLLGFARKSNYKRQVFSLNVVVETVQSILTRTASKNIRIEQHLAEQSPLIEGDRGQIENAVMNLCLNALDAMGDQGTLTMTTRADAEAASISVSDTGSGMDDSVRERVFEPFFTTKTEGKGTGLGLSMVYGVVHAMNGRISLDSAPGQGTRVELTFPRAIADAPDTDATTSVSEAPEATTSLSGFTVLIIDDEPLVLRAAVRMLRTLGCDVISASNGQEGVALFEEKRERIDVAVIDLIMPDMDGIATLEKLLEIDDTVPALLVSGYTQEAEKMEALNKRHPRVRFLAKPYQPAQLTSAVTQLLESSRSPE